MLLKDPGKHSRYREGVHLLNECFIQVLNLLKEKRRNFNYVEVTVKNNNTNNKMSEYVICLVPFSYVIHFP